MNDPNNNLYKKLRKMMTVIFPALLLVCLLSPLTALAAPEQGRVLEQVRITAEAPVAGTEVTLAAGSASGAVPDARPAVRCSTDGVLIEDASWATSADPGTTAPFSGTFSEGKEYAVAVIISPADGYRVDGDTTITVNGNEADSSFVFSNGSRTFVLALSTVTAVRAPAKTILRSVFSPAAPDAGGVQPFLFISRMLSFLFSGGSRAALWVLLFLLGAAEILLLRKKRALARRRK